MTLAEILKTNGVADDVINKITADMKTHSIFTTGEENLDIRYNKLKTDFDNLTTKNGETEKLVAEMKKNAEGNENLKQQIADYEKQVADLNAKYAQSQLDAEIKIELMAAKAKDNDYMAFKLREKGDLELGEDGKIKGIADKIAGLKTTYPDHFETAKGDDDDGFIAVNKLEKGNDRKPAVTTLEDAITQHYNTNN